MSAFGLSEQNRIGMRSEPECGFSRERSSQSRLVKGGSSYLSQSELPVTFGLGKRDKIDRLVIDWPSGGTEEYKNLGAGRAYECVEGKGIQGPWRILIFFQYCARIVADT